MNLPSNLQQTETPALAGLLIPAGTVLALAVFPAWFRRKRSGESPVVETLLNRVQDLRTRTFTARDWCPMQVMARAKLLAGAREKLHKRSFFRNWRQA